MTVAEVVSAAYRSGLRPPADYSVTEWAEANLLLSERFTNYPGPFKISLTPYLREPLDAFGNSAVTDITLASAAQVAKTTFQMVCLGYAIDQDPGPALLVLPNKDLCTSFSRARLHPFIEDSPALASHMPADLKAFGLLEMHMDRMTIASVGSNSPANLSSRPVRYLYLDEVDKYPGAGPKEASAVALAEKRTRTFWNRKTMKTSTPTLATGEIWKAFKSGDQRIYFVPCPHCGKKQPLVFDSNHSALVRTYNWSNVGSVKWPEDARDADGKWDLERVQAEAWYECGHCEGRILDRHKTRMLMHGEWVPHGRNVTHRSYHLSALYPLWVRFGQIARQFLETKDRVDDFRDFINSTLGEPWEERGDQADTKAILEHVQPYEPGTIPFTPIEVVLTADVQKHSVYYVVRAWGEYERSALVRYGQVANLEALAEVGRFRYIGHDKNEYMASQGFVDSGDRADEVYDFCKQNVGWVPIKGFDESQRKRPQPYQWTQLPNGLQLFHVNGGFYKEQLQTRIQIADDSPSSWWLYNGTGLDYAEHLCGEARIVEEDKLNRPHTIWKVVGPNHYLDCEVYQCAIAAALGVRDRGAETAVLPLPENVVGKTPRRPDGREWLDRRM